MAGLFVDLIIITIIQVQGLPSNLPSYHLSNPAFTCPKGEFVVTSTEGIPKCQHCPPDTFIDKENHTYVKCKTCTKYLKNIHHVTETEECTRWSDTKIKRCEPGYFIENTTFINCRCCVDPDSEEYFPSTPSSVSPTAETTKTTQNSFSPETTLQNNLTLTPFNISCHEVVLRVNGCMADEFVNEQCLHNDSVFKNATLCQKCSNSSINSNTQCRPNINDENLIIIILIVLFVSILIIAIGVWITYKIKRKNQRDRPVYRAVYVAQS